MAGIFSTLNIGVQGMRAAQAGVTTSSQSLTNAGTPGYSRRSIRQESIDIALGGGALAKGATRVVDRFVEKRLLSAIANESGARVQSSMTSVIDRVLGTAGDTIGSALDALQSAFADLEARPGDIAARNRVLGAADDFATRMRTAADAIADSRNEADRKIEDAITRANGLIAELSALGAKIVEAEGDGQEASDLRDRRDQSMRELAALMPVEVSVAADGSETVLLSGGTALVTSDNRPNFLSTERDPDTGVVRIMRNAAGISVDMTDKMTSGEIGGLLAARDGALQRASEGLDQLAYDVAKAVNGTHSVGYGLDGITGRNLFTEVALVEGAASVIALDADMIGQPSHIAAAEDPSLVPGDSRNASALAAIGRRLISNDGTATAGDALAAFIAISGQEVASARSDSDAAKVALDQVQSVRDQVSGVSSDEEMMSLTKYQRAYEASMRVVQAADEMLRQLLQMGS